MSASGKILPKQSKNRKHQVSANGCDEAAILRAENDELKREILFHKEEAIKLFNQVKFWRAQCEGSGELADDDQWRRRYAGCHMETQRLEGLLALRDKEIERLKQELQDKDAQIKQLRKDVFDRSSEKDAIQPSDTTSSNEPAMTSNAFSAAMTSQKRSRGGQPGTPRSGPKHHDGLSVDEENVYDLPESCCAECGEQWTEVSAHQSDEVEVQVKAYRRRHVRKKYGHFCKQKGHWVTKTAKGANRLFPHSTYGISFWVFLLVGRFILQIPVNRLRLLLGEHGLHVSQGTITAGFKRIAKLIKPLIVELKRYSREDKHHWHIDDTGWKVFIPVDGKKGYGWHLWVFLSDNVCVYILSPSRARAVPKSHLEHSSGVVTCDRLPANMKLGEFVINSFCWVHERREFRNIAIAYPELFPTCDHFLTLIGSLFHYNKLRLLHDPESNQPNEFEAKLKETLEQIQTECQTQLEKQDLHFELRRVFKGILKDWDGLYLFFEIPEIPPDNNPAEQAMRGPVVSRKCSYGSGSEWSARFLADMYSLAETVRLNGLSGEKFLTDYFNACAANGGEPPRNAANFLPWLRPPPQVNAS